MADTESGGTVKELLGVLSSRIESGELDKAREALSGVIAALWMDKSIAESVGGRNVDRFNSPSEAWEVFWVTHNAPDNPRLPRYILDFIKWLFDKKEEPDAGN